MTPPAASVRHVSADELATVLAIADRARDGDGADPFNEQTRLDLASGRRTGWVCESAGVPVGAAVTGAGELDLVIEAAERGNGYGTALLESVLPQLPQDASAWSHGDHPAARALAASHGFEAVRTLLELSLPNLATSVTGDPVRPADGIRITTFDADRDARAWLALNARAFAAHPEQGDLTAGDLAERMAEDWFDAQDFLVALDESGRMLGFDWLKLEPDSDGGEIYVLGVHPEHAGRGLGRALLDAGLRRMLARGRSRASLYVEGDNAPALALYRRAGFIDDTVDVQYRRATAPADDT